jgi:hypothetical protein
MLVYGNLLFNFGFVEQVISGVVSPENLPASLAEQITYTSGTGPAQVDLIHARQYTLAGAPTEIDLTSLLDLAAASIVFARVRELVGVVVDTNVAHSVTLSGGASDGFLPVGSGLIVRPALSGAQVSPVRLSDPWSVGSGIGHVVTPSSKTLKMDPGSNTVLFNLYLLGCSAVS